MIVQKLVHVIVGRDKVLDFVAEARRVGRDGYGHGIRGINLKQVQGDALNSVDDRIGAFRNRGVVDLDDRILSFLEFGIEHIHREFVSNDKRPRGPESDLHALVRGPTPVDGGQTGRREDAGAGGAGESRGVIGHATETQIGDSAIDRKFVRRRVRRSAGDRLDQERLIGRARVVVSGVRGDGPRETIARGGIGRFDFLVREVQSAVVIGDGDRIVRSAAVGGQNQAIWVGAGSVIDNGRYDAASGGIDRVPKPLQSRGGGDRRAVLCPRVAHLEFEGPGAARHGGRVLVHEALGRFLLRLSQLLNGQAIGPIGRGAPRGR